MESIVANWQSFDIKIALIILVTYVLIDGMHAYYTLAVIDKKALKSA